MKKKTIALMTILLLASLIICLGFIGATGAKEPSERFKGYNLESAKWTTGNLGKAYFEGDFVSYMLRIDKASKIWGAPEFSISFNFHQDTSDAIYVDGFDTSGTAADAGTGFQYSTLDFLPDGTETPPLGWGTHIPTPEAGEAPGPTTITHYMDAWPPRTTESPSDPADERYFSVNGLPWGSFTDHVILFYRAHLALDIIWSAGQEDALPTVLDGDEFMGWTAAHNGASFATGSSRHFFLQYPGIGGKTIPIPIAQYPTTMINGHKYVGGDPFDGWEITLHGDLALYGPWTIPYDPDPVYTGMGVHIDGTPWATGYFEFTGLIQGSFRVEEEDGLGFGHVAIDAYGDGTITDINVDEGWVEFTLPRGGMETVDFYNILESVTTTELVPPGPITLGDSVTDIVTVIGLDAGFPVPTGTVELHVEFPACSGMWSYIGTETLVGAQASFTYTPLAAGTYRFQAFYSGDINYLASQSDPETEVLVVEPAPSETTTLLSAERITLGDSVTDTVTVHGLGGDFPIPTGTVELWVEYPADTWTYIGTETLVDAQSVFTYTPLAAGTYRFKAVYSGDSNYEGSESDPATEVLVVVSPYTGTIGYWRNHPEAWQEISPDDLFPWTTGIVDGYTYMQILWTEPAGDASIQLARQYIGAKLNQIVFGPVPSHIADAIAEAESFLAMYPAGSDPQGDDRAYAIQLADILEDYNSGGISPP